jgi:hypothetical protein
VTDAPHSSRLGVPIGIPDPSERRLTRPQLAKATQTAKTHSDVKATLAQLRAYFRDRPDDPHMSECGELIVMRAWSLGIDPIAEGRAEQRAIHASPAEQG